VVDGVTAAYAGIGSRKTPQAICVLMADLAADLARAGWTLRSGGASGADTAFETGAAIAAVAAARVEVWRPQDATPEAHDLAARFHPAWSQLTPFVRSLHARNGHQIMGRDLDDPVRFVVCWTPDGANGARAPTATTGGTGQAIRIARHEGIPVFNLRHDTERVLAAVRCFAELV
jgi:hypothetical protein